MKFDLLLGWWPTTIWGWALSIGVPVIIITIFFILNRKGR